MCIRDSTERGETETERGVDKQTDAETKRDREKKRQTDTYRRDRQMKRHRGRRDRKNPERNRQASLVELDIQWGRSYVDIF